METYSINHRFANAVLSLILLKTFSLKHGSNVQHKEICRCVKVAMNFHCKLRCQTPTKVKAETFVNICSSKACLPYLLKAKNPHILNISPPLSMEPIWFENHVAYTMAKYGMSMCVLGMAAEFRSQGVAVNALWPLTGNYFQVQE